MKYAALLLIGLLIAGCGATRYQRIGSEGGYDDQCITDTNCLVWFRGNSQTPSERAMFYSLYRCAELTLERGFDYFVVESSIEDLQKSEYHVPAEYKTTTTTEGNKTETKTSFSPARVETVEKPLARIRISMFKGEKPADAKEAYSAREVMRNLEPRIER
ncbi:MAG: hypothetical protein KKB20_01230 [Proteobacteria bacterium]|nr:hypothetical protein [Pseudomonadota bacterium]